MKAGELAALSVRDGTVEVEPVAGVEAVQDLGVRRLVAVVERELTEVDATGHDWLAPALPLTQVVLQAMVEAPGLQRRPTAPLGELLTGAGLETHRWLVGRAGTDWEEWDEILGLDDEDDDADLDGEDEAGMLAQVAELFGVDERAVEGAAMVTAVIELCGRSPEALQEVRSSPALTQGLAQALEVPGVAALVQVFSLGQPAPRGSSAPSRTPPGIAPGTADVAAGPRRRAARRPVGGRGAGPARG